MFSVFCLQEAARIEICLSVFLKRQIMVVNCSTCMHGLPDSYFLFVTGRSKWS